MYLIHLAILVIGLIVMLFSIGEELPKNLEKESLILHPFYKSSKLIDRLFVSKSKRRLSIKKKLKKLNPFNEDALLIEEYKVKRLGNALALVFIGNIVTLIMCLSSMTGSNIRYGGLINRNDYGNGDKKVRVDVLADGERILKDEELTISERQYTESEINEKFSEMGLQLEEAILGKNSSLDHIVYDLNLVDSLPGYPVNIEWELDDYSVLGSDGKIREENTVPEGSPIQITAIMTYFSFHGEHVFNAVIYPPVKSEQDNLTDVVRREITQYEKASLSYENSVLPANIGDINLSYIEKKNMDSLFLFALIIFLAVFIYQSSEESVNKQLKKREEQLMMDYPQIIGKLTLLLGAGMTIKSAMEKLGRDYEKGKKSERYAYEEILLCLRELKSGIPEAEAYIRFGNRCGALSYVKFGALLAQNLKRGSAGLVEILENEERDAFENRKAMARRLGEEAGTKLLAPMALMLVIVLVIVIIPAFLSF